MTNGLGKFSFIFSIHTVILLVLSLASCYLSMQFQITLYADFLIVGIIIAFPMSITLREGMRRREKIIGYLSQFKSAYHSIFYTVESSGIDRIRNLEITHILKRTSQEYINYLATAKPVNKVDPDSAARIYWFIRNNEKDLRRNINVKLFLFLARANESMAYLVAIKRDDPTKAVRMITLIGAYVFAIFYPASVLHDVGFTIPFLQLFNLTFIKVFIISSLYNIAVYYKDPFNQSGFDRILLEDFQFNGMPPGTMQSIPESNNYADTE